MNLPGADEFFNDPRLDPADYTLKNLPDPTDENPMEQQVPLDYDPVQASINSFHDYSPMRVSNPYQMAKVQPFGAGIKEHAFERYYEHPKFDSLGFTPFRDNETFYNEQSKG